MDRLVEEFTDEQRKAIFSIVFDSMIVDGQEPSDARNEFLKAVYTIVEMDNNLENEVYRECKTHIDNAKVIAGLSAKERARLAIFMYQMFKLNQTPITPKQITYFRIIDSIASLRSALEESGLINWKSGIRELF